MKTAKILGKLSEIIQAPSNKQKNRITTKLAEELHREELENKQRRERQETCRPKRGLYA